MTHSTQNPLLPIAITMGDAAGVGPEIIVKAFQDAPELMSGCFVVGDLSLMRRATHIMAKHRNELVWPVGVLSCLDEVFACPVRCVPVWQIHGKSKDLAADVPLGMVSAVAGKLAGDCVTWAANAALRGDVAALVTAPLNKEALSLSGAPYDAFPGHTELLQSLAANHRNVKVADMPVRMMLANPELRVVLLSIHMSLRHALAQVTFDNVLETLQITHQSLTPILGRSPRIGVAGLNPHSGESGLFGTEEVEVISPAIAAAIQMGLQVSGPLAPDTIFMRARALGADPAGFDVVLAMYHDQGLIPIKYLGIDHGVNVTLGLPLIRTSPDHGTAFDIAGQGVADARSLIEAVSMAKKMCVS